jgi:hypothetical protein
MKKILRSLIFSFSLFFLFPSVSFSATICNITGNSTGVPAFDQMLTRACDSLIGFSLAAFVIAVIVVGFMFIASRGDPAMFQKASKFLLYIIIGAVVIFATGALMNLVNYIVTGPSGP